jgi:hypothetical protein
MCPQVLDQSTKPIKEFITKLVDALADGKSFLEALLIALRPEAPPPPPPPGGLTEEQATLTQARIRFGSAGCTATLLDRTRNGKRLMLTAYHCVRGQPIQGSATFPGQNAINARVIAYNVQADICVLELDTDPLRQGALVRPEVPPPGTAVWHRGYGIDKPGSKVEGTAISGPDSAGMIRMRMTASPGDSGAAVFDQNNMLVCLPVCCVSSDGSLFGGGPTAIHDTLSKLDSADTDHYALSYPQWKEVPPIDFGQLVNPTANHNL